MLLVKKEDKMIGYGKISNKDVIPFIDENNGKIYIIEVLLKDNDLINIKVLEKIRKNSEMDKILNNLYVVCKEQNENRIYNLEAL